MMSGGAWILQATLEKVRARIAVSEEARRTVVEHLGGDAVLVPNGVDVARFAAAAPRAGVDRSGHHRVPRPRRRVAKGTAGTSGGPTCHRRRSSVGPAAGGRPRRDRRGAGSAGARSVDASSCWAA